MTAQASRSALPPIPAPAPCHADGVLVSVDAAGTAAVSTAPISPLRRVPVQGRSVARVARMLDACAALVDEIGYEALTTTLLADRAGVAIGSIYQFFPDKRAVVQALTLRNLEAYLDRLTARFADGDFANWWDGVDAGIDEYIAMHRDVPGFRTLHFGDVVDVHLLDEDRDNNSVIASALAALLAYHVRDGRTPSARLRTDDRGGDRGCADQAGVPARSGRRRPGPLRGQVGDPGLPGAGLRLSRSEAKPGRPGRRCGPRSPGPAYAPVRLQPGPALATVGRHRADHPVTTDQLQIVDVLAQLAGLRVAEPDPVADPQRRRRPGRSAASAPRRCPRWGSASGRSAAPGWAGGSGSASPEATQPPPSTVAICGLGLRTTDRAKYADGSGRQAR